MTEPRPASYSWALPHTIDSRVFSIGSFQRERNGPVSLLLRMTTHESAPLLHIVAENRRSETTVLGSMKRNRDLTSTPRRSPLSEYPTTRELSQGDSNRNAEWGDFYGWMRRVDPRPPLLRMLPGGSRYKTLALMSSSELFSSSICWISSLRFRSRSSSSDSTSGTLIAVGLFGSRVAGTSGFVIFKMS